MNDKVVKINLDNLSKDDLETAKEFAITVIAIATAGGITPKVAKVGMALLLASLQKWEENGGGDLGKVSQQTFSI